MKTADELYQTLIARISVAGLHAQDALAHIGTLTDLSLDLRKEEGLERALQLGVELGSRGLAAGEIATLYFFMGNAWANLRCLRRQDSDASWAWEQAEMEQEIIHFRKAVWGEGFGELEDTRKCEILTNVGNLLNHVGRFSDAIEYWDRALGHIPSFGMALGNRGLGLTEYARSVYDDGHAALLLKSAHQDLVKSLDASLHPN